MFQNSKQRTPRSTVYKIHQVVNVPSKGQPGSLLRECIFKSEMCAYLLKSAHSFNAAGLFTLPALTFHTYKFTPATVV